MFTVGNGMKMVLVIVQGKLIVIDPSPLLQEQPERTLRIAWLCSLQEEPRDPGACEIPL